MTRPTDTILCAFKHTMDGVHHPCGFRARWWATEWFCGTHDPLKPRCQNLAVHPTTPAELARLKVEAWGRELGSPCTPQAVGVFVHRGERLKLCSDCAIGLPQSVDFAMPPRVLACVLCKGTTILRDDDERPVACVCTPAGRYRVNGATDEEVLRRIERE